MSQDTQKADTGVRAVHLAFDVLEAVASEQGEVGVSELALRIGTTKGTVFRHLQTLVDRGYLSQNPTNARYRLGVRAHLLGQASSGRIDLLQAAETPMRALREETGSTVVVSAVSTRGVTVLATVLGKSALEIGVRPGSELDLHCSAQGKVATAFGPPALLLRLRRSELERKTPMTCTDIALLEQAFEACRRNGYATACDEETIGINALAAPLLNETGLGIGTVAIVGSIQHIAQTPTQTQIDAVLRTARAISHNLGFSGKIPA
ncbi:MAG: IclR family transcriptional regulator [Pseudorhodobacter sp. PARRP1]|nr:MAG: IclR family transcriptional regulator [Pseudorhodobacter sp. PARRP1]